MIQRVLFINNIISVELTEYRGGCIACMDYYAYAADSSLVGYINLFNNFFSISNVLLKKLNQFESNGFDPANGFLFGFSFGSQMAYNAGRGFGGRLAAIDGKKKLFSYILTSHDH